MCGAVILLTLVLALSFVGPPPPGHVDDEGTVARALQEPGEPVAVISPLPERVSNGTDMILSASQSYDTDGDIVNYTWEIEVNGTVAYVYGRSKWYQFEVPGLYMIKLTVTDEDNKTGVDFTATLSMVDSDEDGLFDWWEEYYLFNLNYGAVDDPDGDGYRNIDEYYSGTDPRVFDDPPPTTTTAPGILETYWHYILLTSVAAAVAAALLYRRQRRRRKEESVRKMDYAVEIAKALETED